MPVSTPGQRSHDGGSWNGQERFGDIFCLTYPDAPRALRSELALESGNAVAASRVVYSDRSIAAVVASTLPDARTASAEIAGQRTRLEQLERRIGAAGGTASHREIRTAFGPGLAMRYQDVEVVDADGRAFPVGLALLAPGTPPRSASAHRIVVRGGSRYEIAALSPTDRTRGDAGFEAAVARSESLADAIMTAFETCTSQLPTSPVIPRD